MRCKHVIFGLIIATAFATGVVGTAYFSNVEEVDATTTTVEYVFSAKSWTSPNGNWTADSDASGYANSSLYLSGSSKTCTVYFPTSFQNISNITYSLGSSGKGSGSLNAYIVGQATDVVSSSTLIGSNTIAKSTTTAAISHDVSPTKSGYVKFVASSTAAGYFYVKSISISYTADTTPSVSISEGETKTFMVDDGAKTLHATTKNMTTPTYLWEKVSGDSCSLGDTTNAADCAINILTTSETPTVFKVTATSGADSVNASISVTAVANGASSISWTSRPSSYNEGATWSLGGTAVATMNDSSTKTLADTDVDLYVNSVKVDRPYTIVSGESTQYKIGYGGVNSDNYSNFTITPKATSLTIAPLIAVTTIQNDQTLPFTSSLTPSGAWDSNLTWASSNTNVATIDETGLVTAVANGTTNITATTNNGLSSGAFALTVQDKVVYTVTQLTELVSTLANNGTFPGTYYVSGTVSSVDSSSKVYLGDGTSTILLYNSSSWTSEFVAEGTLEAHGTLTKFTTGNSATNYSEIKDAVKDSYEAPLPTSLTISGDAEFDIASSLTKTYTVTSSPTGSSSEVTWSIDSSTDNGAAITSGGVLTVTKDGTTTIKATSTADNTVSATKVINAYALASVVGTFKDSPKTTYYVSQSLESDLLTYAATYKCGDNATYKTNVDVTSLVTTDYGIATSVYNNGAFVGTATSLAVTPSAALNSVNASYSNTLTINVYNIVISSLSWSTKPTKTSYKFGEDLSIAGGVFTVVYEHSYPSSNVDVTADMVSGYNSKKLGKQTLTLTYEEHTLTYDVTVTNVGIVYSDSVSITGTSFGAYAVTEHTATSTSGKTLNLVSDNVGCFSGTVIQFQKSSGNNFYNSNSLGTITTIVLTGTAKSTLTVYAGSTAHPTSSAVTGTNGSYTIGEEYFTIMNNTWSTATIASVAITIGSSVSSSEQAASARDYLQQFRSCTGGWVNDSGVNSRAGVVQLIAEYNAMKDESKTAFASLALTVNDYDDKKSNEYSNGEYGTADPSVSGVNALVKLKRIVKEYNATKVSGETALSLSLPGGDTYSGSPASPFLFGDNNDITTQIVIGSLSVVALGGVIVFAKKKKAKNRA